MKIPCDVVRDLLPLYRDGVCSESSRALVEEHLEGCGECRRELELMGAELPEPGPGPGEAKAARAAASAWRRGRRRAFGRGAVTAVLIALAVLAAGGALFVRSLPVAWDAGACGGGYGTFIFDKYSDELTEKFVNGSPEGSVVSARAVRGTQEAQWEDRTLFLQFDIRVEYAGEGERTLRVHFVGKRTWFDTYDWSGARIEG